MKLTISIIAPWVFFYMAGSFIGMQFNPVEWSEDSRATYIMLSVSSSLGIYTFPRIPRI